MKHLIIVMLFLQVCGSNTAFSQESPKPQKENFAWQKQYMDEAGIPADTQAKIEDIKTKFETKLKEVRKEKSLGEDEKKEKLKELQKQKGKEINDLLTKEQKEKIKIIKERLKKDAEGG